MFKLIKYEFIKLFSHKNLKYIFVLLFLVSLLFVYLESINYNDSSVNYDIYQSIQSDMNTMELKEKYVYLEEKVQFLDKVSTYEATLHNEFFKEDLDTYDSEFINKYGQFIESKEYDNYYIYYEVYNDLFQYYNGLLHYDNYLKQVLQNGEKYQKGILWIQADPVKKYDILNAMAYYDDLKGIKLQETNTLSIDIYNHMISPYFVMVIVSILVALYVYQEDEKTEIGQLQLISLQGKYKTAIAKLIVITMVSIAISLVIGVSTLILLQILYGFVDGSITIQSISSLYESPYQLNIKQYLSFIIILKTIFLLMIVLLFCGVHKIFKNGIISVTFMIIVFVISGLLYFTISDTQTISLLKYLNVYAFLCSNHFFASYMNGLAYYHLDIIKISLIIAILTIIISLIVYFVNYATNKKLNLKKFLNIHAYVKTTNLFIQELFKNLWINKTIVFIVLLLIMQSYFLFSAYKSFPDYMINNEKQVALEIQKYNGKLSDEDKNSLESKNLEYIEEKNLLDHYYLIYLEGKVSQDEYNQYVYDYLSKSEDRLIFNQVYEQYQANNNYLTYSNGFRSILSLNTYNRETRCAIFLILSIIFLTYSIITSDRLKDENNLYMITIKGKRKRLNKRLLMIVLFSVGLTIVYSLSELLIFKQMYPMNDWSAPLSSILTFDDNIVLSFPFFESMPIWQYYIQYLLLRVFALISCSIIGLGISYLCKNKIQAFILAVTIFLLPLLVYSGGLEFILSISIFDIVMGNLFIQHQSIVLKIIGYAIIDICILVFIYRKKEL